VIVMAAWAEPPDIICVVYRFPGYEPAIGLRRVLDPDLPDYVLIEQIVNFEIGEPLGTIFDAGHVNADGTFWWDGATPIPPDHRPGKSFKP
jgi:hypothetical protein